MGDSSGTTSYTETVPKHDTDSGTHPPAGPRLSSLSPPHRSHFAPSSSTTEDQERCRKRPPLGGARQPTDIDRSLARSLGRRRGVFTFSGVTASSHAHARRWHGPTTGQGTPLSVPPPLPTPPASTANAGRAGHSGLRKRKYDRDHRQLGKQANRSLAHGETKSVSDRSAAGLGGPGGASATIRPR